MNLLVSIKHHFDGTTSTGSFHGHAAQFFLGFRQLCLKLLGLTQY
jgi:hypothetical protein